MYATDRGIDELVERRGDEKIAYAVLAEALRDFVDLHPETENTIDRLAVYLARDADADADADAE